MMVVLNSRISISHNENSLTELSWRISTQKPTFSNSQGGISVTHEHWTNPLELEDYKVGITVKTLILIINIQIFVGY